MVKYSIKINEISKFFKLDSWNLSHTVKKLQVIKSIDNISFNVEKGKMIGIIGKNGSGKTTLLRTIAGIFHPDKGSITVNGKIGPLLQVGLGSNDEFTVAENIITYGILLGFKKKIIRDKIPEIIKFAELEEYHDVKMKYLSSGMKVRIMFSTAMLMDPDILLVDEVLSVGDASFREKSFNAFLSFKKRKKTIILVSHNLTLVRELCDEVYVMDKGKIMYHGDPKEVVSKYESFCKN